MQQIPFLKAFQTCKNGEKIPFSVMSADKKVRLEGFLSYDAKHFNLLKLSGILIGSVVLTCDLTGEDYEKALNEPLEFYLSDGIVNLDSEHFEEIVECVLGNIDFDEILRSELEMIACDYHAKD